MLVVAGLLCLLSGFKQLVVTLTTELLVECADVEEEDVHEIEEGRGDFCFVVQVLSHCLEEGLGLSVVPEEMLVAEGLGD